MYPPLQTTVARLLRRFGAPRTIRLSYAQAGPVPWKPSEDEAEEAEVLGVVLPANARVLHLLDHKFEHGLIESNVRLVKLAAVDADNAVLPTPKPADRLHFDDATWSVLGVTPVSPGGIPLLYTISCQR